MNKVNIRVYKRGYKGTILIWNIDPLTEVQRDVVRVYVRPTDGTEWTEPETAMPDVARMGKIMDGQTDTITIVHDESLTDETPFTARLIFGSGQDIREATLDIEPKNQHKPYVKTERYPLGNGQFIYADPAYIIGIHPLALEELGRNIAAQVLKGLGK